jgi:hypothetical protein
LYPAPYFQQATAINLLLHITATGKYIPVTGYMFLLSYSYPAGAFFANKLLLFASMYFVYQQ